MIGEGGVSLVMVECVIGEGECVIGEGEGCHW